MLRKAAAHDLDGWVRRVAPDPERDPVGYASVAHSHPRWVVEALSQALGSDTELEAMLAADNAPPRVTLAARPGLSTVEPRKNHILLLQIWQRPSPADPTHDGRRSHL